MPFHGRSRGTGAVRAGAVAGLAGDLLRESLLQEFLAEGVIAQAL